MQLLLFPFFNEYFHQYLGTILFNIIPKQLLNYNITSLEQMKLASVFADRVKYTKQFIFTRTWHYLDVPEKMCQDNKTQIMNYIYKQNNTGLLKGLFNGTKTKTFEFHLHFLQDLVQPFHNIDYFNGGNSLFLFVDSKNTSLHVLWDSILPKLFDTKKFKPKLKLNLKPNFDLIFNQTTNQIFKSFKRACQFRLPVKTSINSTEYFKKNNLQDLFQEIVQDYLDISTLFFTQ